MLSDGELRSELVRLGVNPGPITGSTRPTYEKKLKKLLNANKTASNGYGQSVQPASPSSVQPASPSNGHEPANSPTDSELREQLQRLGHNPGPITPATRGVYLKKLAKLRAAAATTTDANGYSRPAAAADGAGARRRRPPTRPDPRVAEPDPELMDDSDPMDESDSARYDSAGYQLDDSPAAAASYSPVEYEFSSVSAERYDSPSVGFRSSGRSPMYDADLSPPPPPPPPADQSSLLRPGRSGLFRDDLDPAPAPPRRSGIFGGDPAPAPPRRSGIFGVDPAPAPPRRSGLFGDDPAPAPPRRTGLFGDDPAPAPPRRTGLFGDDPAPAPPRRSGLFGDDPAPAPPRRSGLFRDDQVAAVQSRYRPEPLSRARLYPETLNPRGAVAWPTSSLLSDRRPTPPPPPGRAASYQLDGGRSAADWRADTSPTTRVEPPPAGRPDSLRQRMAAWCRPSPPAAADYDTCSDSEPEEPEKVAPPAQTPSQQLQAFRRRMTTNSGAAAQSDRGKTGFQAAAAHGASHVVPYCILLLAVLFFGVLVLSYLRLARTDEAGGDATQLETPVDAPSDTVAVFPICGDPLTDERGCVSRERLEPAVQLLSAVLPAVLAAARDALCGRREQPDVPLTELAELTGSPQDQLRDLAVLVAYNSHLGLRAEEGVDDTSLTAVGVSTPWLCLAGAALTLIVKWAFTLGAVSVGFLVVRGLVLWRRRSQQLHQQQLYQMVENIMDVVRRHTLMATGSDKPYVAVDHVRDELLTPAQRSSRDQMALWQRAVHFIRDKESRVREECVMVAGESHTVWRWLPSTAGGVGGGGGRDRRRVWLGQAFQTSSGVNTPVHTRTNCLKIRHMFDPTCETSNSGWQQDVRDALLEKCEGVAVMHIAVDDRSTEGLVYVKCPTDADALSAFKRIQGCWFDGRLVSVKFIRLERYHERYPDAVTATAPLRPSNALRRSLSDLPTPAQTEDD